MRSKMVLEGTIPKEEQEAFKGALAYKVKENYKKIDEQRKAKIRSELLAEEERARKKNPSRYGGMIRGARDRSVNFRTPWKNLFETPKTEYDVALEDAEDTPLVKSIIGEGNFKEKRNIVKRGPTHHT